MSRNNRTRKVNFKNRKVKPKMSKNMTEMKYFDGVETTEWYVTDIAGIATTAGTSSGIYTANLVGGIWPLNNIRSGTGYNQRIGNQVQVRNITIDYELYGTYGNSSSFGVRVILLKDTQSNGTALTAASVFQNASFLSPRNVATRDRYKILSDVRHNLVNYKSNQVLSTLTYNRNIICSYLGDTGGYADLGTNALYLLIFTDDIVALDGNVTIPFINVRIGYFD